MTDMGRVSGYDFMNLVMIFDNDLHKLITDLEKGEILKARLRALDMRRVIKRLEDHVDARGETT